MEYGVLVDLTKCIGCRACQVACKRWNSLPAESTTLRADWTNPPRLSYITYTHIRFNLSYDKTGDMPVWNFLNWRCMHCTNPACLVACPTDAIVKTEEGAVVVLQDRCIGCKKCVYACPFEIPQYDPGVGKVSKCHMCYDRIPEKQPSCVQACPTRALLFDKYSEIEKKAQARADVVKASTGSSYIYGAVINKPLGGTHFVYVAGVPLTSLGIPNVAESMPLEIPAMNLSKLLVVPAAIGGLAYLVAWRKKRMEEKAE